MRTLLMVASKKLIEIFIITVIIKMIILAIMKIKIRKENINGGGNNANNNVDRSVSKF